jgi:hypothetical protein
MSLTVSGGGRARVCNARCYDAKKQKCVCICGGRNHGAGLNKATENLDQKFKDSLTEFFKKNPSVNIVQPNLPFKP